MGQNLSYPDPRILSAVKSQIDSTKILVVSKTGCGACKRAKQLLNQLAESTGVAPSVFEIDSYGLLCTNAIIKHLSAQTGVKTVPQIWINGSFVGGNDAIQQLHREGRLLSLIRKSTNMSQTLQNSFSTTTSLRIAPIKANVIPLPFLDNFPIQINPMNKYKSNRLSIDNGSSSFSSSVSATSAMSYQDNTMSNFISPVSTTYANDDYKQLEPAIMKPSSSNFFNVPSLKSSTPQHFTSSTDELETNWLPISKKTVVNNVPSLGAANNRLFTDEEILAVSWV